MSKYSILLLLAMSFMTVSCSLYKRTVYLQDMDSYTTYLVPDHEESKIRKGDILRITVASKNAQLAAPFNLKTATQDVDPITNEVTYAAISNGTEGYLVDENGNINFPVLGMLHVEGRTLTEVRNWVQDLIIQSDYIKEPIVTAEFVNFQFTMLGEGGSGNYTVSSGDINIFQAIAMAGGLSEIADRGEVSVIRTVDGTRKVYNMNLLSKSCFESPAFYLQQNDMVLVKPLKYKRDRALQDTYQTVSTVMSFATTIATILVLLNIRK